MRLNTARNEAERVLTESRTEAGVIRKTAEVDAKAEFLNGQEDSSARKPTRCGLS